MMLWFAVILQLFSRPDLVSTKQQSEFESNRVTVHTSRGSIRGFHVNNALLNNYYKGEADVFLGIPYAESPVGEKRFQKSEVHGKYEGIINANRFGDICPQRGGEATIQRYDVGMSEDCLTLSIFAPNVTDKTKKYPVMVYIYGGSLASGNHASWMYHGIVNNIVRRGIIWIAINYRVGFHGFFTTYTPEFPPNRGIWDQISALQWIHEEIENFGGRPDQVTVIGHSAGACSASYLALSPAVDPSLVSKIIMMSASAEICFDKIFGEFTQSLDRAEQLCKINARDGWTAKGVNEMLQCVSKLSYSQLTEYDADTFRWNAVIDGDLFIDVPTKMKWRDIPMLSGSTTEEFAVYELWKLASGTVSIEDYKNETTGAVAQVRQWIKLIYGENNVNKIMNSLKQEYDMPDENDDALTHMKFGIRVLSDLMYIYAVGVEAEVHLRQGLRNIWLWQIDFHTDYYTFYKMEHYNPSYHGIELFLLMQPDYAWVDGEQPKMWTKRETTVANDIANEFVHFATYGYPSSSWEPLKLDHLNYWKIDYYEEGTPAEKKYLNGYGGKHYQFWKNISSIYRISRKEEVKRVAEAKPTSTSLITAFIFGTLIIYFATVVLKVLAPVKCLGSKATSKKSNLE